jgi:hypothetical protein
VKSHGKFPGDRNTRLFEAIHFLKSGTFANFMPQVFREEDRKLRVSKVVAAS